MKLCAVMISYYPDKEFAIENINKYIDCVDCLIIWENTPEKDRLRYRISFVDYVVTHRGENNARVSEETGGKVVYLHTGNNEGIGYALNAAINYARSKGYTHILTMDQDSTWLDFRKYKSEVENLESEFDIIAPNINGRRKQNGVVNGIKACITSGSIYKLDLFSEIGFFREDFFIDGVDTEFCYRAVKNKKKILVLADHKLMQRFGERRKKFGFLMVRSYSAFRTYHIIRNHITIWREYPDIIEPRLKKWIIQRNILKRIPKIFFLEDDKVSKYNSIIRGIRDGLRSKNSHQGV